MQVAALPNEIDGAARCIADIMNAMWDNTEIHTVNEAKTQWTMLLGKAKDGTELGSLLKMAKLSRYQAKEIAGKLGNIKSLIASPDDISHDHGLSLKHVYKREVLNAIRTNSSGGLP